MLPKLEQSAERTAERQERTRAQCRILLEKETEAVSFSPSSYPTSWKHRQGSSARQTEAAAGQMADINRLRAAAGMSDSVSVTLQAAEWTESEWEGKGEEDEGGGWEAESRSLGGQEVRWRERNTSKNLF